MESDQRRYQDVILAPIWAHLQYLIEDESPIQSMVIQRYDALRD
jgi:hypothetical protein